MFKNNIDLLSNFNKLELYFLTYVILINFITFIVYGIDKNKAKNKQWRIPESTLIFLCLMGGSVGGLISMVVFKHKLSKKKFYIGIPSILILNKIIEMVIFNYIK